MFVLLAVLSAISPVPLESRQMVLSMAPDWNRASAQVRLFERADARAAWRAVGPGFQASLGRAGLAWGSGLQQVEPGAPQKKEGDGRSPAGVFDLREGVGYEASAPDGARLPYRQATTTLRCVDDPASRYYNQLVDESGVVKDWRSAEDMRRTDELYRLVVWVAHNDAPPKPGGGSCIFLHYRRTPRDATVGCTAFDARGMERVFRWLDPAKRPVLVQLPRSVYRARRAAWGLPRQ